MVKRKVLAVIAGTAILAATGGFNVAQRTTFPGETVIEVIDGDTFYIANHQRVRVRGIDAPEVPNCFSEQAKIGLEKLILNKQVILRAPLVDSYGRVMADVYIDRRSVGEYMIKNGFAYFRSSNTPDLAYLQVASDFARENKLGIFTPKCYQIEPPDPKCPIKGNFDDNSDKKVYFLPGCSYYDATVIMRFRGEQWFCTEAEARKVGFEKSKYCDGMTTNK